MRPALSFVISSVVFLALSTGCRIPERNDVFRREETRTLELKPGGQLRAQTFNGSITVEGWDKDEVHLVAKIRERREGEVCLTAESQNGQVIIKSEKENERNFIIGFGESNGVSYTLKIPRKTMITVISSNGRMEISALDGEVDATTSNGSITANSIKGKTRLSTSNATIRVEKIIGDMIARTSNGSIDANGIEGTADLRTSNGRIIAKNIKGKAEAVTSNGSIIAETIGGDLVGRSSNGRIGINGVSGAIDMSTSNASIKAENMDGLGRGIRLATSNASIDVALGNVQGLLEAQTINRNHGVNIRIPNVTQTVDGAVTRAKIGNSDQLIQLTTTHGSITVR
ncbi:MAG: hypothetical protein FWG02_10135 [Holophagaceae bacterium]|nr:hypothetical protein [Holophagaceae bacterium]